MAAHRFSQTSNEENKGIVLGREFFDRPTRKVARDLLGKFLVRRYRGRNISFKITDVEVYDGFKDKASHAARGETERNKIMFGHPGHWYIYFTYGMHWLLNIVTREKGYPAAILIRGAEGVSGPARLTKALHLDKKINNAKASRKNGLWIEDRGIRISPRKIKKTARLGVDYAGDHWAQKKLRYLVQEE